MTNKTALIGYTGFVGSTLLKQRAFSELYRSTNIAEIRGKEYDLVVAAAAPAKKWLANLEPFEDQKIIDGLISSLREVKAKRFVLISTVDVFSNPVNVDESSGINCETLQPYGYNRRRLELFVKKQFKKSMVVRLPGLVGNGLRKNIIFDFVHNNQLEKIDFRNVFQFYPMANLWRDIEISLQHNLELIHLTSEPISVFEVAKEAFGLNFTQVLNAPLVNYDFRTKFHRLWDKSLPYQYSKFEALEAIKEYARSEMNV